MIGPGQPLNFDPGFTDAYEYGLYGLHRLINDATRIPRIRPESRITHSTDKVV